MYFPKIIEKSKYSPRREGKKNQVKTFGYFGCVAKLAKQKKFFQKIVFQKKLWDKKFIL